VCAWQTKQIAVADDRSFRDRFPLPVGLRFDMIGFHAFAKLNGLAHTENVEGLRLAEIEFQPCGRRAIVRGIEGYVLLEFTVTRDGGIRDPKVIDANPPRIFDQAALDAVGQFRYIPRVVNGEPVEVDGVTNRIALVLTIDCFVRIVLYVTSSYSLSGRGIRRLNTLVSNSLLGLEGRPLLRMASILVCASRYT